MKCVDLIITDMAVFQIEQGSLVLLEYFSTTTIEEIKKMTACPFKVHQEVKRMICKGMRKRGDSKFYTFKGGTS